MFKYILLGCLIFTNFVYASDKELVTDNKLKAINMLSVNGVWCNCHVAQGSNIFGLTGGEYAWNYFVVNKVTIGMSYNLLAANLVYPASLYVDYKQPCLSLLGLRISYYLGNKKSIVVPNISVEGRVPVGSNTYETGGLLWNYNAGSLIKLHKNVYIDFEGSIMKSKNYNYYILKLGMSNMIY